jgi:hypothetical protein
MQKNFIKLSWGNERMVTIYIKTDRLLFKNLEVEDVTQNYVDWLNNLLVHRYLSCSTAIQTMESC